MEPWHPITPQLDQALIPVILAFLFLWLTMEMGWWDKFFAVSAEWYLHGVMGLWGE